MKNCKECGKNFEPKYVTSTCCSEICHRRARDRRYKDKIRHGKKRTKLIKENGLICEKCGKKGNEFQIVAHHESFDKFDHENQVLLCRSCHSKEHGFGKPRLKFRKQCEFCNENFTAKYYNSKYCSSKCKRKAEYARDHVKIKARVKAWKQKQLT
jgi:hypothetical protein